MTVTTAETAAMREVKGVKQVNRGAALPDGWTYEPARSVDLLTRIIHSYRDAISDTLGVEGFLDKLRASHLLLHDHGWVYILPMSTRTVEFHGGRWEPGVEGVDTVRETRRLLDFLHEEYGVDVFYSPIPETNKAAIKLVKALGFEKCGMVPFGGLYRGVSTTTTEWVRVGKPPAEDSGDPEE